MRRRSSGGDIYQVDLIAALFAGYTIIWLVTSDKADLIRDPSELIIASLQMTVEGLDKEVLPNQSFVQRAAPLSLAESSCVPDSLSDFIDSSVTDVVFCSTSGIPRPNNKHQDSLSVLEGLKEPCATKHEYESELPSEFHRVIDASLIEISWPPEFTILGAAYSELESWPVPLLPSLTEERIPRYVDIKGGPPPNLNLKTSQYPCSYERDRQHLLQAIFVTNLTEIQNTSFDFQVGNGKGDLYYVYKDSTSVAESFFSKEGNITNPLKIGGDWGLDSPVLHISFCIHNNGTSIGCWTGNGDLVPGANIVTTREI